MSKRVKLGSYVFTVADDGTVSAVSVYSPFPGMPVFAVGDTVYLQESERSRRARQDVPGTIVEIEPAGNQPVVYIDFGSGVTFACRFGCIEKRTPM